DYLDIVSGGDFKGLVLDGFRFSSNWGEDEWDTTPWDTTNFNIDSYLDVVYNGGTFTAPSPSGSLNVYVTGGDFIQPQYADRHPDEEVQVQILSPITMDVYSRYSTGSYPMDALRTITDGIETNYTLKANPFSYESILVFAN